MGRKRKVGLEYFPMDVDMFQDIKIRKLIRRQGGKAVTVYTLLLCFIYKSGYYIGGDEELPFIISEQTGFDEAYIQEVIKSCFSLGLFNREMYEAHTIITSASIQYRYKKICADCKRVCRIDEYNLISSEEKGITSEEMQISSEETRINSEKSAQSKVKESKYIVVVEDARVRASDDEFLKTFFGEHQLQIEALCMQLETDRATLEATARHVLAEWELTKATHSDYNDKARHLINQLRIKVREMKKQKQSYGDNKQRQKARRGGAETVATAAEDYEGAF